MDDTELARLHQAVQADPVDTAARLALLYGLVVARRWHEAEQVGNPLLQAEDAPAAVHTCMGTVYGKQGRLDEAVQQCRQSLALAPDDVLALFNLGTLLARQDDSKAALECLDTVVDHAPDWAEAHYTRGTVLLRQERYQEAIRAFDRALEADGSLNYYELDCAINAYKTAIQQRPGYTAALYNLGMVYQRMGSAEGVRVWNQYIEAAQDLPDEEIWRLRAQEYTRDLQDRLR